MQASEGKNTNLGNLWATFLSVGLIPTRTSDCSVFWNFTVRAQIRPETRAGRYPRSALGVGIQKEASSIRQTARRPARETIAETSSGEMGIVVFFALELDGADGRQLIPL
jgi:hypothetical protein